MSAGWLLAEGEEPRAVTLVFVVADVVDLEGSVGDAVLLGEEVFEVAAPGVAVFATADEDVGREGREAGGDRPYVKVVYLHDAFRADHLAAYLSGVYPAGGCFEENVRRVSEEGPGAHEDQSPYRDAGEGVRIAPAGEDDDQARGYGPERAEGVGDHVPEGALHVQALSRGAREDDHARCVDEEPEGGDRQHGAAQDLRRLPQAREGLHEDPDRDRYQRHPVRQGRKYLGPFVAEAPLRRLWPTGEPGREERNPEREVVREHVTRVSEQREAAGEQAADDLGHREARCQGERDPESPLVLVAGRDPERRRRLSRLAARQQFVAEAPVLLVWVADLGRARRLAERRDRRLEAADYLETALIGFIDV